MNKVVLQVRYVFQEHHLMPHGNMIEQDQMLVQLTHVAHMRYYGYAEFSAKQAHGNELTYSAHPYGIYLDETRTIALQVVFKYDPVRHMFSQCQLRRCDDPGQCFMSKDIVGMYGLFYPIRLDVL